MLELIPGIIFGIVLVIALAYLIIKNSNRFYSFTESGRKYDIGFFLELIVRVAIVAAPSWYFITSYSELIHTSGVLGEALSGLVLTLIVTAFTVLDFANFVGQKARELSLVATVPENKKNR